MKIKMNFGWVKNLILCIVMLGALAIIGLDIALLAGDRSAAANTDAIAGVSLGAAVLILLAAALILFNSYYEFKDDKLIIMLGFFRDKISYGDIVMLKQNGNTKELFIVTKSDKPSDADLSFRANVNAQGTDLFIEYLHKKSEDIIVEVFTPENKDKD